MPGPEVAVKARAPFQEAPITMPIEASSSSPCTIEYFALPVSMSCRSFLQWLCTPPPTPHTPALRQSAPPSPDRVFPLAGLGGVPKLLEGARERPPHRQRLRDRIPGAAGGPAI